MKKFLSVLLSLITVMSVFSFTAVSSYAQVSGDYEFYVKPDRTVEITSYKGSLSHISIPSKIDGYSVSSIGPQAFYQNTSITEIDFPNTVKSISKSAFAGCVSLSNIYFNSGLESIGETAFLYCKNIKSISIPSSVNSIGVAAFFACPSLQSVSVPETVTNIGALAFGFDLYYDSNGIPISNAGTKKVPNFTLKSLAGTKAESYARENGLNFVCTWFPDVSYSEWYYKAVRFNVNNGYFNGYANGYFGPADRLQRQDFIINLAKIANADLNAYKGVDCGLTDVSKDAYYSSAVAWSVKNSVVGGYQDGRFGVSDSITREQICVILYKYMANYLGEDVSLSEDTQTILSKFSDKDNISTWAVTSVAWAVENGIVGGGAQTSVNPLGNATRAEVAQIFMNMSNNGLI